MGRSIQLEIVNVQTGEWRPLTSDKHLYTDPVFSPDGSRVAYISSKPNGYFNVYVRPIRNGEWSGRRVAITRDHSADKNRLYFGEWTWLLNPSGLPDGKELVFRFEPQRGLRIRRHPANPRRAGWNPQGQNRAA